MLTQPYRELLIGTTINVFLNAADCRTHVEGVRQGAWASVVPINSPLRAAFVAIVENAESLNWVRDLVQSLVTRFAARSEFARVLAELDRAETPPTVADPFQEVLLEADRPFVNRRDLRNHLLDLTSRAGSTVLLIDGDRQSGKSFSYYFINHVAAKQGFIVNKFRMSTLPKPDQLAADLLERVGVERALPPQGQESAERWAEKLAGIVARAVEEKKSPRLFVFDEFSDTPLPEGTASVIIRLATYADEELRPYLRVVAMRFNATLPSELDNVALRDTAVPFTATDMLIVVMQVAKARQWNVTQQAVFDRINAFDNAAPRTLSERFKFLRGLLQELAKPKT